MPAQFKVAFWSAAHTMARSDCDPPPFFCVFFILAVLDRKSQDDAQKGGPKECGKGPGGSWSLTIKLLTTPALPTPSLDRGTDFSHLAQPVFPFVSQATSQPDVPHQLQDKIQWQSRPPPHPTVSHHQPLASAVAVGERRRFRAEPGGAKHEAKDADVKGDRQRDEDRNREAKGDEAEEVERPLDQVGREDPDRRLEHL